jgi:hypothetical protein
MEERGKQWQKSLNERLDKLRFDSVDGLDFDAKFGNHSAKCISVVNRTSEVNLYKGDIRIFLTSGNKYNILLVDTLNPT